MTEIVLVAHGTRNPHGVAMIGDLADAVAGRLGQTVRVAFVDVLGPTPDVVLETLDEGTAVVIPAFLARGHHVHVDIPEFVARSGHPDVVITPSMGPSDALADVLADRLRAGGWRPGDATVLAAAGSSDPRARRDVESMAARLAARTGGPVSVGVAAPTPGGPPSVASVVADLHRNPGLRVAVASFLLAEGLFQDRLRATGAEVVTAPLGLHDGVIDLLCARANAGTQREPRTSAA